MAKRYMICKGDKTSHGGEVLEGNPSFNIEGVPVALVGHRVSCPKCVGEQSIVEGDSNVNVFGLFVALEGMKTSCGATLISSQTKSSVDDPYWQPAMTARSASFSNRNADAEMPQYLTRKDIPANHYASNIPVDELGVDAGFSLVTRPGTRDELEADIFTSSSDAKAIKLFREVNDNTYRKPGAILLLVDPNKQIREQVNAMEEAQAKIDQTLSELTLDEANFLFENYDILSQIADKGDKFIGYAAGSSEIYFDRIHKTLSKVGALYESNLQQYGKLNQPRFFAARKEIFNELDSILKMPFTKRLSGLEPHIQLKHALGLSSQSIVHKWNKSGTFDVSGYATSFEKTAKIAKYLKYGGYVAIGFSAMNTALEINKACTIGRENECQKTKYTEIGKFIGGTMLGVLGGITGYSATGGMCIAIGAATFGAGGVVCAVVATGAAGYIGSEIGSSSGDFIGEKIYENTIR